MAVTAAEGSLRTTAAAPPRRQALPQAAEQGRLQGSTPGATGSKAAPARGHGEGEDPAALPAARCTRAA